MYKLKLLVKDCISCGICMDVCIPGAIGMRINNGKTIEGDYKNNDSPNNYSENKFSHASMMTFPYMANPELCNNCMICSKECPTSVIEITKHPDLVSQKKELSFTI